MHHKKNIGMYCGNNHVDDSKVFICERYAMPDLLEGLKTPCICGMASNPWTLDLTIQVHIYNGISYLPLLFLTLVYLCLRKGMIENHVVPGEKGPELWTAVLGLLALISRAYSSLSPGTTGYKGTQ